MDFLTLAPSCHFFLQGLDPGTTFTWLTIVQSDNSLSTTLSKPRPAFALNFFVRLGDQTMGFCNFAISWPLFALDPNRRWTALLVEVSLHPDMVEASLLV